MGAEVSLLWMAAFALCAPWLFAAQSVLITLAHSVDEVVGDGGPIWEYLRLPAGWGLHAFGLFGAAQCWLAVLGYADGRAWALWALLACRVGDVLVSHWIPAARGRRPNPGLATSPLYALDAALAALAISGSLL